MSVKKGDPHAEPTVARDRQASRRRLRSGPEVRQRRRRLLIWGLFIASTVLMVNALVGERGYLATIRARREYAATLSKLNALRLENQALKQEAERLKRDPAMLEETARRELGLIKPGETLIVIHDANPASPTPTPR
jgi:cell division protein FtsB